jgi:hypothetical protein
VGPSDWPAPVTARRSPLRLASGPFLAVVAAVLLILASEGPKTNTTEAGAGYALLGAAVVRTLDELERAADASERAREAERRGKDETRRLLYMCVMAGKTGSVEVAATLANALVHHHGADRNAALANLPTVLNGATDDSVAYRWMAEQLDKLTAALA